MANGRNKRTKLELEKKGWEKQRQELEKVSNQRKAEYHQKLPKLKKVQQKHKKKLLAIQGVSAIGLDVFNETIIVYSNEEEGIKSLLPSEIEGYPIRIEPMHSDGFVVQREFTPNEVSVDADREQMNYLRPIPPGSSLGHNDVTAGTLGSWWYSKNLGKIIGISNNHVLVDADKGRQRRMATSEGISLTYVDGGYNNPPAIVYPGNDFNTWNQTDIEFQKTPTITSVYPTSFSKGDLVKINGTGLGFRQGYSKVFFNGIETPVYTWGGSGTTSIDYLSWDGKKFKRTDVTNLIQVYVPNGLTAGNVTITVQVEGDLILNPGSYDVTSRNPVKYGVGMVETFIPLNESLYSDFATFSPYDPSNVDNRIFYRGGYNDYYVTCPFLGKTPYANKTRIFPFKETDYFQPTGFAKQSDLVDGLACIKTGRTTGTTVFLLKDTHFIATINYGGVEIDKECIYFYPYKKNGNFIYLSSDTPSLAFATMGDSGSSIFTCPPDIYDKFFNTFSVENKIIDPPPVTPVFSENAFQLVGSYFAGNPNYEGLSDNAVMWMPEVADLGLTPLTFIMSMNGTSFSDGNVRLKFDHWLGRNHVVSSSTTSLSIQQITTINLEELKLETYTLPTDYQQMDFALSGLPLEIKGTVRSLSNAKMNFGLTVEGNIQSISGGKLKISIVIPLKMIASTTSVGKMAATTVLPIRMASSSSTNGNLILRPTVIIKANGQSVSNGTGRLTIPFGTIQLGLSASSNSNGNTTLKLFVPLVMRASAVSTTSGKVIMLPTAQIKSKATSCSSGNVRILILPVGWTPNLQYEYIYFEITRSHDINTEITKSIDLNLAV